MPYSPNAYAPVVVFTHNREPHLKLVIDALRLNAGSCHTDLIIYSDGPKTDSDKLLVERIRKYCRSLNGFKSIEIIERLSNFGLAKSIISGIDEVLRKYPSLIILEDDLVTSPLFLDYMNCALNFYASIERVGSIHGYIYPALKKFPEAFFLRGGDCWGWATWRRAWKCFNPDGKNLLDLLKAQKLENEFDLNGAYPYMRLLSDQVHGLNQSWAIRWHASLFLKGMLTLYPGRSYVHNIGLDGSGTHCGATDQFDVHFSDSLPDFQNIPIAENEDAKKIVADYLRTLDKKTSRISRLLRKIKFV